MIKRSTLTWQIVLLVVALALTVALLVLWIINNAAVKEWLQLVVGIIFFIMILLCVVFYFVWGIKEYRLNRRQANFIDSVTHELKSPLASIKLCLQTLELRTVPPEKQQEFLKFVMEDVERLDALIDHLLTAARIENAPPSRTMEEIAIDRLLAKCADEIRRRYELNAEQIRLESEPCRASGELRDLEMVFLNLLDNAVKYGGGTPQVLIQVHKKRNNRISIAVSDNGRGVQFDLRTKIFQKFFRGGSELERVTKGTGLGLYLVKTAIRKMKGKIQVHNRGPLQGATFEVELPGCARSLDTDAAPAANQSPQEPGPVDAASSIAQTSAP